MSCSLLVLKTSGGFAFDRRLCGVDVDVDVDSATREQHGETGLVTTLDRDPLLGCYGGWR